MPTPSVRRWAVAPLVALGALLALLTMTTAVSAASVTPTVVGGASNVGKTCADLFPGTIELKFDPAVSGTKAAVGGGSISIVRPSTTLPLNPNSFDWTSEDVTVFGVIVKDGVDGANVYDYRPDGATSDTYLTTPNNGDKGISHISFCYLPEEEPDAVPLEITKTAEATFDRTFTWTINKDVDKTSVTADPPGPATFNYTVTVGHDAGVESGYAVTGVITVNNPNDFAVVADVTDFLDDGTECTVTDGLAAEIPADDDVDFNYTCAPLDDSATENEATVTWGVSGPEDELEAGSATATEPFTWTVDVIDECVDVTDTFDGVEGDLGDGTLCVGDDPNPTVFMYARQIPIPQFGCLSYTDTAAFITNDTDTTGSSSETVQVCSAFEGCTPGYWKQTQHFDSWVGFTPNQTVLNAGITNSGRNNTTLVAALGLKGGNNLQGAKDILLRAAVAALLNEANPAINYGYDGTLADLKAEINAAMASGSRATILALATELDMLNNAGCPLN